jgi:hypothetical protein
MIIALPSNTARVGSHFCEEEDRPKTSWNETQVMPLLTCAMPSQQMAVAISLAELSVVDEVALR